MAVTKRAKTKTTKQAPAPAKKAKSAAPRSRSPAKKPSAKRTPAPSHAKRKPGAGRTILATAPLLAAVPKKVGKVTNAVKPAAPYQPKTDVAPIATAGAKTATSTKGTTPRAVAAPDFDPLALARPWLRLGAQIAMSNLTLQVRIAKVAMDLPPAAIAMRHGSAGYKAWLAMFRRAQPAKD